jgi:predicted nucleic acid-binding protein
MNVVFADAYYYLALVSRRATGHGPAATFSRSYRGHIVTTPWVLTEVGDALALPHRRQAFAALLGQLKADSKTTIVAATDELFNAGCDLYSQRPDKSWSLTDCISFVVMKQHGIMEALTADRHFEQAGFAVLL